MGEHHSRLGWSIEARKRSGEKCHAFGPSSARVCQHSECPVIRDPFSPCGLREPEGEPFAELRESIKGLPFIHSDDSYRWILAEAARALDYIDRIKAGLHALRVEFAYAQFSEFPMFGADGLQAMAIRNLCSQAEVDRAVEEARERIAAEERVAIAMGPPLENEGEPIAIVEGCGCALCDVEIEAQPRDGVGLAHLVSGKWIVCTRRGA